MLFALAQHDLKRLLAYHSVENIGIIALGLGVGMLGLSSAFTAHGVMGFAGGLLHVLNHACFKGLLFLGAGAVLHATGTREIDASGRAAQADAVDGVDFSGGGGGHLRVAAVERVRERVARVPGRVGGRCGRRRSAHSAVLVCGRRGWR